VAIAFPGIASGVAIEGGDAVQAIQAIQSGCVCQRAIKKNRFAHASAPVAVPSPELDLSQFRWTDLLNNHKNGPGDGTVGERLLTKDENVKNAQIEGFLDEGHFFSDEWLSFISVVGGNQSLPKNDDFLRERNLIGASNRGLSFS
jgi:hypothetical protein